MTPDHSIAGWHATDDDVSVTVRSSSADQSRGPASDIAHGSPEHIVLPHHGTDINAASMRLSAFLGVALVLGAIGFHFGFGSIVGDLTGVSESRTTVEITAEGTFSPHTITVQPGDTLILSNKNPDPQVIKAKDGRELFAVQVLFDNDFEFTVPSDAHGTYTYFSETLPDDRTLTISVATPKNPAPESPSEESLLIPLPFDEGAPVSMPEEARSSSPSVTTVTVQKTEHSGETATISLTGEEAYASSKSSEAVFTSNLPTNPYTVTRGAMKQNRLEAIVAAAKETEGLHSGAPLREMMQHRPTSVTNTGPEGALLLVLPALLGVAIMFRKLTIA